MSKPKNILVIRNDKLGDFMLAWPALSLLKQQYPESTITALVPAYTKPLAEICPWIDNCITDEPENSVFSDLITLKNKITSGQFDSVITLYSEFRTGLAIWLTGIPTRIAPATKLAQIFYNKKLTQRRSRSKKPEYLYNVDLVRFFIQLKGEKESKLQIPPYLTFKAEEITSLKNVYRQEHKINVSTKLVFIHPGTGGSAINLSTLQFAELAKKLSRALDCYIVITTGPDELATATELSKHLNNVKYTIYHSTEGIVNFSRFLAICDLFISGSTGPLHIAGALNRPTVAFYPARRSATPLRWQTLNQKERRLAFTPDQHIDENDMKTINLEKCTERIVQFLASQSETNDC